MDPIRQDGDKMFSDLCLYIRLNFGYTDSIDNDEVTGFVSVLDSFM